MTNHERDAHNANLEEMIAELEELKQQIKEMRQTIDDPNVPEARRTYFRIRITAKLAKRRAYTRIINEYLD